MRREKGIEMFDLVEGEKQGKEGGQKWKRRWKKTEKRNFPCLGIRGVIWEQEEGQRLQGEGGQRLQGKGGGGEGGEKERPRDGQYFSRGQYQVQNLLLFVVLGMWDSEQKRERGEEKKEEKGLGERHGGEEQKSWDAGGEESG